MIIRRRFLIPGLGPANCPGRVFPDFAFYKPGAMPQDNLPGKLRAVGPFGSYIFLLHLVELAMHKAVNAPSGGPRRLTDRAFFVWAASALPAFPGRPPVFRPAFPCGAWMPPLVPAGFSAGILTLGHFVPKCQPPRAPVQSQPQKQSHRARQLRFWVPYAFGPPGVVYSVFASFFISSGRVVKRS